jgi:hypothetical protein
MPYYFGEDMVGYTDHIDKLEDDSGYEAPESFEYMDPWQANAAVLSFPETPGPEPRLPPWPPLSQPGLKGFLARLFGRKAAPETAQLTPEEIDERRRKAEEAIFAYELWAVSGLATRCRGRGVKRVFDSYDGSSDESFTHLTGIEMRDGRVIPAGELGSQRKGVDCTQLVDAAVSALMEIMAPAVSNCTARSSSTSMPALSRTKRIPTSCLATRCHGRSDDGRIRREAPEPALNPE